MNKEKTSLLSNFDWANKDKTRVVEIACTRSSRGANLDSTYYINDYYAKTGEKVSFPQPRNISINYNSREASFSSLEGARMIFIRVGEPKKIVIDFETEEGKFLWTALAMHPDINVDSERDASKKTNGGANFTLTIPDRVVLNNYAKIKEKLSILQTVWNYDYTDLTNLVFYLGKSTYLSHKKYMTDREMVNSLIGKDLNGWAVQQLGKVKEYHQMSDTPARAAAILFNKARSYEIVKYSKGYYMFNDTDALGGTEGSSIEHLVKNIAINEKVRTAVAEHEENNEFFITKTPRSGADALPDPEMPDRDANDLSVVDFEVIFDEGERRRIVEKLTNDGLEVAEISRRCNVHHMTVRKLLKEINGDDE